MPGLNEKNISSDHGTTYYWTNGIESAVSLVFLPGLSADHRLFEPQLLFSGIRSKSWYGIARATGSQDPMIPFHMPMSAMN